MNKERAIQLFGNDVVELARSYYETDFGKVLFEADIQYEEDSALETCDPEELRSYLQRAFISVGKKK